MLLTPENKETKREKRKKEKNETTQKKSKEKKTPSLIVLELRDEKLFGAKNKNRRL